VYAMAHQSFDGRFRISPVGCRGRAITPEVLSAAYEISGRALSHAEKVLNCPAVALSAFEEMAPRFLGCSANNRGVATSGISSAIYSEPFFDSQIRLDAGKAAFTFEKRMILELRTN